MSGSPVRSRSTSRPRSAHTKNHDKPLPSIAAVFVIKFDQREGYKLVWSKSIPDIELEGVVDFKSLPSGLHNVKEDLVYFVHGEYAGISAFVNVPGSASERNAQMLAVGALVPLSYGRLGKSWTHAKGLQELAKEHVSNTDRLHMLEEFWEKHRIREGQAAHDADGDSPAAAARSKSNPQSNGYRPTRAISDATTPVRPNQTFPPHHPAISLPKLINDFGPLLFPLYRAALLRKRILMVGEPPVEQNCNLVYDLSVLSSVPPPLLSLLPIDSIPALRLRPLFNVGVQDIPVLQKAPKQEPSHPSDSLPDFPPSWVACTTDDVLATKPNLYDILVTLPSAPSSSLSTNPTYVKSEESSSYPIIYPSSPTLSHTFARSDTMKATQRDLRRYTNLRSALHPLPSAKPLPPPEERDRHAPRDAEESYDDGASVSSATSRSSTSSRTARIVEPTSWALIAYTSFIWWASAGEKKAGLSEDEEAEMEQDRALLFTGQGEDVDGEVAAEEGDGDITGDSYGGLCKEMAIVGYFHRLTALLFTGISDAISRVDGEDVRRESGGAAAAAGPHNQDDDDTAVKGLGLVNQESADSHDEEDGHRNGKSKQAVDEEDYEGDEEGEEEEDEDEDEGDENAPLLSTQSDRAAASAVDDDDDDGNDHSPVLPDVEITSADMTQMGLDMWSRADAVFVEELVQLWWGRRAVVHGAAVECCGIRVV